MDKIDTLFKNPCFGKASIGRNSKTHHELTQDVLLQNLSTQLGGIHNSPVDSKSASTDEELLDNNVFMRHPRYFTEDRESSLIPITGATCMSLSAKEKFSTERHRIHITEEPVYDTSTVRSSNKQANKCRNLQIVESPKRNTDKVHHNHVANTTITDDSNKAIEYTDDIMDTKLNCTLLKISSVLQEISTIICNDIQPIESDGDNSRRQKRVTEFFSRFTRNYLYQLVRQLSDARKLLARPPSCKSPQTRSAANFLVQDKLSTVCHTVLQALQAYSHHVPLTVASSAHSKCLTLVAYIQEMCKLLRKHLSAHPRTMSCVHDVEQHSHTLVDAINECLLVSDTDKKDGRGTRVSLATVNNKSTHTSTTRVSVPFHKRQSLDKRLAMYNTSCAGWKRNATILAKQRFNVQSRYKLGTYKPPIHCEARTCLNTNHKAGHSLLSSNSKKSLGERRPERSPVTSRVDEDSIPTMVEIELQKERQLKELLAKRTHKHNAPTHESTSSEEEHRGPGQTDRVPPRRLVSNNNNGSSRKKQEDNFKTMLQYLLVQLQQQEQQSSKEIAATATPAEVEETAAGRSVVRTDNSTNAATGNVFDKLKGLVAHVRGITDATASSFQSSNLNDKRIRDIQQIQTHVQVQHNVQQSKTRVIAQEGAPNAKLICIKDKSCFQTDNRTAEECVTAGTVQQCTKFYTTDTCVDAHDNTTDNNVVTETEGNKKALDKPDKHIEEKIKELQWTEPKQIPDDIVDDIIKVVYADIQVDNVMNQLFTSEFT